MKVKFIHTADWHVGKPFAGIANDQNRALVKQERLEAIGRLGNIAVERGAEFVLVAGDLFDSPVPAREDVTALLAAVGAIGLPVLAIPGNHDHGGAGSVWESRFFQEQAAHLAPAFRVLLEPVPVVLDHAVILPCPLRRRHESEDPTAWLRGPLPGAEDWGERVRIVLAHGSVQQFTTSEDDGEEAGSAGINFLAIDRLPPGAFDYLALGDWHGSMPVSPFAWYSGTPEIDRFPKGENNRPGNILVVEAKRGQAPSVETVSTQRLSWLTMGFPFTGDDSLAAFKAEVDALIGLQARQVLLIMELDGSLGLESARQLDHWLVGIESRLLRLKLTNRTAIAPTPEEIEALAGRSEDPLIARVARRLIDLAQSGGEQAAPAALALRELHARCHG